MARTLGAAMALLERERYGEAAEALAGLASDSHDGVIARFRRAECLSRLGRHEEAIEEARRAVADEPHAPATAVWLQQALAEAGRFDEAAEVQLPAEHAEYLDPLGEGYSALAHLAAGDSVDREATARTILDSRHAPLYSLAVRVVERERLSSDRRAPDLPSVWYALDCRLEMEDLGLKVHPPLPSPDSLSSSLGWLRLHASCGDWSGLVEALRERHPEAEEIDAAEIELAFALGQVDRVAELLGEPQEDDDGERCLDRVRVAQLRGEPATPSQFPGHDNAAKRHARATAWLEMCAALLGERPLDARARADRIADPAHRDFVEAALDRWAHDASS